MKINSESVRHRSTKNYNRKNRWATYLPRQYRHRQGFILLYLLVLIAIAGLLLVGMTRDSLATATEAIDAEQALQNRWGILSCQRTLLAQPKLLLTEPLPRSQAGVNETTEEEVPQHEALLARNITITLGDRIYHILVADESAKVNVNKLLAHANREGLVAAAERLSGQQGNLLVQLPPQAGRSTGGSQLQSWGQIFAPLPGMEYDSWPLVIRDATADLTCWGDGQLNFHLAVDEAVLELALLVISESQAKNLLKLRDEYPTDKLDSLLDKIDLNIRQHEQLDRLFTGESTCYSAWIDVQSPRHRSQRLCISNNRGANRKPTLLFQW